MPWKKFCLAVSLSTTASVYALVEEEIDEKHPIEAVLSRSSHNRVAVEGGAVEKIFGDSAFFSVGIDPSTGNAFVSVLQDILEKPATLSVVTSSGLIQDILVTSTDGPSEQILLKEREEDLLSHSSISLGNAVHTLNQIFEGKVPFGFGQRSLEEADALKLPEPLTAEALKAFEGPFETIVVYRIENQGKDRVELTSDALKQGDNSWAFLDGRVLEMGEHTLCLLGRSKDGNGEWK